MAVTAVTDDPGSAPVPAGAIAGRYVGGASGLFPLAMKTALLTLVTLGIYRFWARTRIRRYIWASTAPDGEPFEYTGTGLEKLLGFLVAVIVLAIGLALIQIVLMFLGLSLLDPDAAGFGPALLLAQSSLLLLIPLGFYARYRARRYKLARTRWRGIRFALEPGALGYAWRGSLYLLLAVATLGVLWPLMTFRLEKYRADRTWYGSARLHQGGDWRMLYRSFKFLLGGLALLLVPALYLLATQAPAGSGAVSLEGIGMLPSIIGVLSMVLAPFMFVFGILYYRVDSFRRMTAQKRLGQAIRFESRIRATRILWLLIRGALITAVLAALAAAAYAAFVGTLFPLPFGAEGAPAENISPPPGAAVLTALGIFVMFALYGTLTLVFITQPIIAHVVGTTRATQTGELETIRQRDKDRFADADGFAAALDVGGAF